MGEVRGGGGETRRDGVAASDSPVESEVDERRAGVERGAADAKGWAETREGDGHDAMNAR